MVRDEAASSSQAVKHVKSTAGLSQSVKSKPDSSGPNRLQSPPPVSAAKSHVKHVIQELEPPQPATSKPQSVLVTLRSTGEKVRLLLATAKNSPPAKAEPKILVQPAFAGKAAEAVKSVKPIKTMHMPTNMSASQLKEVLAGKVDVKAVPKKPVSKKPTPPPHPPSAKLLAKPTDSNEKTSSKSAWPSIDSIVENPWEEVSAFDMGYGKKKIY